MTRNDHGVAVEKWLGIDRRAPQKLMRKARSPLIWIELLPNLRVNPVGADQDIGFIRADDRGSVRE
jgi:hypothetical protein